MAQTTGAISFKDVKLEISTNGTVWTDISGFANEVGLGGGDRALAETFTFDTDTPIITPGKRASIDVTVKAVYTEGGSDPYVMVESAYQNGTKLYLRWSPKGGSAGQYSFAADPGYVAGPPYPRGSADSADAVPLEFTVKSPKITRSTL